jgi:hypothetical protein
MSFVDGYRDGYEEAVYEYADRSEAVPEDELDLPYWDGYQQGYDAGSAVLAQETWLAYADD